MKEKLEQMKAAVETAQADLEKFEGGNASAGARVRASLQDIKKLAQEVRVGVQEIKNAKKKK